MAALRLAFAILSRSGMNVVSIGVSAARKIVPEPMRKVGEMLRVNVGAMVLTTSAAGTSPFRKRMSGVAL
jgi:hypothetical protein